MEPTFPLHVRVCAACCLGQLGEFAARETIFADDYAYFSSVLDHWVEHARRYAERMFAERRARRGLAGRSRWPATTATCCASSPSAACRCSGVEPTANTARRGREPRRADRRSRSSAARPPARWSPSTAGPDLVAANNVLAHVPDLDDFVAGFALGAGAEGLHDVEIPHVLELLERGRSSTRSTTSTSPTSRCSRSARRSRATACAWSTSRTADARRLAAAARRASRRRARVNPRVDALLRARAGGGLDRRRRLPPASRQRVEAVEARPAGVPDRRARSGRRSRGLRRRRQGQHAAQLLRRDATTCWRTSSTRSPHKQGRFAARQPPADRAPERVDADRPDDVLILPWNLADEIIGQMARIRDWGGRFAVADPAGDGGRAR